MLNYPRRPRDQYTAPNSKYIGAEFPPQKLLCRQAQNEVKFDFQVKFVLEGHGQSHPKIIGILTKMFGTSDSNLVILAWTADELWCGQASDDT